MQNDNLTYNNITYRQMIETFDDIATNHTQIKSFNSGSLNDVDIEKLNVGNFPLLYVTPNPVSVAEQSLTYSFDVIVATIIQEDFTDIDDAYTQMLLIAKDVISQFRQSHILVSYADQRTTLTMPINLTPFTSRFSNMLTGWGGTFEIVCNNVNNVCISPMTPNDGN
tara:strand:- start:25 stop:525 length:501 start_codon:yes stop_codon:yes gene_type:complete